MIHNSVYTECALTSGLTHTDCANELMISNSDKFSQKYQAKRSTNINVYDNEALLTSSMFSKELMSTVEAQKLSKKKTCCKIQFLDAIFAIQLIHVLCFVIIAFVFAPHFLYGLFASFFINDLYVLRVCVFKATHNAQTADLAGLICLHVIFGTIASIFMLIICFAEKNVIFSYGLGFCQILFWFSSNIGLILSYKNESRFTSHDQQCYNKLCKWLHKKHKRCNNLCNIMSKDNSHDIKIFNDKVIRLIAINLT